MLAVSSEGSCDGGAIATIGSCRCVYVCDLLVKKLSSEYHIVRHMLSVATSATPGDPNAVRISSVLVLVLVLTLKQ